MADDVFQFAPEGPASRGSIGASAASPTLGVSGGNTIADDPARFLEGASPDLSGGVALPDFLYPLFKPKLDAEKTRRFQQGYMEALQGKSQEEINKESPWYSRVFGPVPFQLGAAKYAVDKQSADAQTYFINELPRLRTMPTEDVANELQQKFGSQVVEDDPYTTAMLSKSFMDRLPDMINLHTKARYAWEQEQQVNNQLDAALSVSDAFSASRKAYAQLGNQHPDDVEYGYSQGVQVQNLLRNLAPPEYQDPASTQRYYKNLVMHLADNGNYDVLSVLMQHGLDKVFDADEVDSLDRYVKAKYAEFGDKTLAANPDMLEEVVKLRANASNGVGGAATARDMHDFDNRWQAMTGYMPYFDGKDYANLATTSTNAAITNEEQAQRAAAQAAKEQAAAQDKEMDRSRQVAAARNAWLTGQGATYDRLLGVDKELAAATYVTAATELAKENPALAAQVMVYNYSQGQVVSDYAKQLQQQVDAVTGGGAWSPAFDAAYTGWKQMTISKGTHLNQETGKWDTSDVLAGRSAAKAYYGDDINSRMEVYDRQVAANVPKEAAYLAAFGASPSDRPAVKGDDAKQTKAIQSGLRDVVETASTGTWSSAFGSGIKPTQSGRRLITRAISDAYSAYPNTGDPSIRLKNAYRDAQANGLEVHGRAVWINPNGGNTKRIATYFGLSDDAITPSIDRAVMLNLKRVGFSLSDDSEVEVIRNNDEGGDPSLLVIGTDAEGQKHPVKVTRKDIDDSIRWMRDAPRRNREAIEKAQMEAARLPKL